MNKIILITLLALLSLSCFSKEDGCLESKDGKLKYLHNSKIIINNDAYCFNSSKREILQKKCTLNRKLCQASEIINREIKINQSNSDMGNPTFKVCHTLKGSPMIMSFWNGDEWIDSSICIFPDKSFIDLSRLYSRQKVSFK